ncbi:MAG: hypothetical protein H7177_00945 [Rhizobacter sp.]|nr:hypothetical protein [Bacteriovorax sp.]
MKAILFTFVTLFSINAMADQCQAISRQEGERALLLLQTNAKIIEFCEPCLTGLPKSGIHSVVETATLETVKLGNETYTEVKVNDSVLDLAYTFVQVAPNRFVNVAKAISCETLDESSVSSVINTNLKTIK